jgi:hypothetical protein
MKRYLQIALFLLISFAAKAQQNYFVYLQTDNKQPFYVKLNSKVLSSSPAGYLVIPKLSAGSYNISIGFPKNDFPAQELSFVVTDSDGGYLLKNFGEKGWGLYNLQSMEVTMAGTKATGTKGKQEDDDAFSNALSTATNTTVVKTAKPVAVIETPKPKPAEVPAENKPVATGAITSLNNIKDASGRSIIYIDKTSGANDTVTIFIPAEKPVKAAAPKEPVTDGGPAAPQKEIASVKETVPATAAKDKRFLDIDLDNPNSKSTASNNTNTAVEASKPVVTTLSAKSTLAFNSDCKANASDDDFLKIRKKMAAETTDEGMVGAAKKFFKTKCYSVEQIKNLSLLFLSDAGKYSFFDASYAHIYDPQNFALLESQLKEEYFINRFKAMIRN